jgi:polyhydroxyalkanoate synthesis regulator phasin
MDMVRKIRKAVMAGLGMGAWGVEHLDDWVRRGEETQNEWAKSVRKFLSEAEKNSDKLEEKGRKLVRRVLDKSPIPTRSDLERLEKQIHELSHRMKQSGKG